ncbi:MAG: hypothetical protein JNM55_23055 [Anaerolineales bacterium]|nr:hypothetical protein [Anaerolineales bacterium]
MDELLGGLAFVLMLVVAASMGLGVNLEKWYGWAQVLSGFILGFLMGQNLIERIVTAIFFGLMTFWLGPMVWKRKH